MRRIELGLLVLALFGLGGVAGLPAQAAQPTYCESNVGSPSDLKELKHGLLQGYLDPKTLPDSLKLLAPPPAPGSAAQALAEEIAKANFSHEGTARWSQAHPHAHRGRQARGTHARPKKLAALLIQMPIMAALRPAAFPRGLTNLRPHTTTQNEDMGSGQRNRDQGHAVVDHEARLKRLAE